MTEPSPPASTSALRVLSTLATQGAWPALSRRIGALTGCRIEASFGPTNGLMDRIRAGETADAAILTRQGAGELADRGVLIGCADFARSYVGIAVKAGAPKPDISTVAELKSALLGARSVAYSRIGASGVYFAGLIERLGIADAVKAKAVIVPAGFTAERLVTGEVDLAVQQISELKAVAGIEVVAPLPMELQEPSVFTAGVFAHSANQEAARRLVDFLASAEARPLLTASGLEPIDGAA